VDYVLAQMLVAATPIIFAGLGGIICERSGVINFALEGKMLAGAFAAAVGAWLTGNPWVGLACAAGAGVAMAALHGFGSITLRSDQIVSSFAVNFIALGLAGALLMRVFGRAGASPEIGRSLPAVFLGPLERFIGKPSALTLMAFAAALAVAFVINRTRFGLELRACGAGPVSASAAGVRVDRVRWAAVLAAGALAGVGGGFLVLSVLRQFTVGMVAGRGFVAVAAVILSGWRPGRLVLVSLGFGMITALTHHLQGGRWTAWLGSAGELVLVAPFVVVLLVAPLLGKGGRVPAGLGKWAEC